MKYLIPGFLFACLALAAATANFSGKWALQSANGRGGGRGGNTILQLNQSGNDVTGTITLRIDAGSNAPVNMEIFGGKADGDTLSFYVWTGTDQPVKTSYRGTLAGDDLTLAVTAPGGRGATPALPQQMTAKRVR